MATTAISANDVASALDSMAETWENGGNELDAEFCTIAASMLRSLSREDQRVSALHAAAPDLLAALKEVLFNSRHGNGLEALYAAHNRADAAIAKAEGAQE